MVFVPTPIPPAAVNGDGIVCSGRGRMWAGEREQSDGYSVNVNLPCWYVTSNKVRVVSFPYIDTSAVLESIFTCMKNMKIS